MLRDVGVHRHEHEEAEAGAKAKDDVHNAAHGPIPRLIELRHERHYKANEAHGCEGPQVDLLGSINLDTGHAVVEDWESRAKN